MGKNDNPLKQQARPSVAALMSSPTAQSGIFAESTGAQKDVRVQHVEPKYLLDSPYQKRKDYGDLDGLADSIMTRGFRGALPVRLHPTRAGFFQLAFGHRRREAAKMAGVLVPVIVSELSDEDMAFLALRENLDREDLSPLEEGASFLQLNRDFKMAQEAIAQMIGEGRKRKVSRGYVRNRMNAATLALRFPKVEVLLEQKPDSLRAIGYLDESVDEASVSFVVDRLTADNWTADTVADAVKVLKIGGREAELLLQSYATGATAQAMPPSPPTDGEKEKRTADNAPPSSEDSNHVQQDGANLQLRRTGLVTDALKRFRRYSGMVGDTPVTGDERTALAEMVALGQAILERS